MHSTLPSPASQPTTLPAHLVRLHHEQHLAQRARTLAQHLVGRHGDDGGQPAECGMQPALVLDELGEGGQWVRRRRCRSCSSTTAWHIAAESSSASWPQPRQPQQSSREDEWVDVGHVEVVGGHRIRHRIRSHVLRLLAGQPHLWAGEEQGGGRQQSTG